MTLRRFLFLFLTPLLLLAAPRLRAQAPCVNTDSLRTARQASLDSAKEARATATATRTAVQKRRTDSLAAVRKYRESRRYTDSVARVRKGRLDSVRSASSERLESLKAARQQTADSIKEARQLVTAPIRAQQQARADSLAAIRKYRDSKRFADSVVVVRKTRADSLSVVRKERLDSMTAARKAAADAIASTRKQSLDSLTAIRTLYTDSIKAVRKVRTDSMAAVKKTRDKAQKEKLKEKQLKLELALDLRVKKKRQAWSNEQMLKKKWSVPRKALQNTFTRYNYYFNAERKMDEAMANMLRMRRENYDSLIALYPFDPDRDSAALKPDMDSIIQKASIGIQIHDPRTKWGDDLYLLLGQAYYYKGDYENAASAFRYIVSLRDLDKKRKDRERAQRMKSGRPRTGPSIVEEEKDGPLDFIRHQAVHNEALLWLSRTYVESGRTGEAESVLDLLSSDPKFPERLKARYALEKSYLTLAGRNPRSAGGDLATVAAGDDIPNWLRQRAAYLAGQLAYQQGSYAAAAERFRTVISLHPAIEMDFYARKYLAYSVMEQGGEQADAIASLRGILKDNKYSPYFEQVYFVLGRLSANSGQYPEAIGYLRQSIASGKATKRQKAQSFASLGDSYYATGAYESAKVAYDSAAILGGRNSSDPAIQLAARRAKTLDAVAGPARTIRVQDSLLALGALSPKDQRAAVRKYLRSLETARNDSAFRAENGGLAAAAVVDVNDAEAGDWYFANATLMQQGATDFKRRWGNRPLADNWRRSAALNNFAGNAPRAGAVDPGDPERVTNFGANGLPSEESLLAAIPTTSGRQDDARKLIRRAYADLGTAYIQSLEDYPRATATLDTLDRRFTNHEHAAEVLYLRYLTGLRQNNIAGAQTFANKLVADYPTTSWAKLVKPSEDAGGGITAGAVASAEAGAFYEEAYTLMQGRQYSEALSRSREGRKRWADKRWADRFLIIEATSLAGVQEWKAADTVLRDYLSTAPPDSLRTWAESVRAYVLRNKPADTPAAAAGGAARAGARIPDAAGNPEARLNDPAAAADGIVEPVPTPADAPAAFVNTPAAEHYFVFAIPKMEQRAMGMKAGLADFNSFKFDRQKLTSGIDMLSAQQGLIVTRTFPNASAARIYANAVRTTPLLLRDYKSSEYTIFVISATNYKKLIADRSIAPYLEWYSKDHR